MFNGILNLDNKESIVKEFSNMVESVEKEITNRVIDIRSNMR